MEQVEVVAGRLVLLLVQEEMVLLVLGMVQAGAAVEQLLDDG